MSIAKIHLGATDDEFQKEVQRKRVARMDKFDKMPPDLRKLSAEYGYNVVQQFLACGIINPRHIRHLVEVVLDEFSPTRASSSCQGPGAHIIRKMTADHLKSGGYQE